MEQARVILHMDFDSYYTQVEMKRLGIPRETPCAVQQWEGLIAVNYPARAKGVTRHMRIKDAKKVCPELVLVHVETIGSHGGGGAPPDGAPGGAAAAAEQEHSRLTQKACLERYRRSTAEVLVLLHRLAPAAVIEKASIDEVYMDVTSILDKEMQAGADGGGGGTVDAFSWGSIVVGGPLDVSSEFERRLAAGAGIACRLRGALLSEMGYTASAGIASNKLLAKIGSAMHKPNQQTVIPPRSALQVTQDLPLGKLWGFGGKLGEQLAALGCATAGQVQQLPRATLAAHFGPERAAGIEQAVRGVSHEPVQERERPKSMLAAKSFSPTSDVAALEGWLLVLAQELAGRMASDEAQYRRRPKNLVLHYRGGPAAAAPERSKTCAMPRPGGAPPDAEAIAAAACRLFQSKCAAEALPCSRLAISAADFTDLPAADGSAITRFLVPRPAGPRQAAAPAADAAGREQQPAAARSPPGAGRQRKGPMEAASIASLFQRAHKRLRHDPAAEQPQQQGQLEEQPEERPEERECPLASCDGAAAAASARGGGSPGAAGEAAGAAEGPELEEVDVQEQRRILRDIRMRQALHGGRPDNDSVRGGPRQQAGRQGQGQRGISAFFRAQPKPLGGGGGGGGDGGGGPPPP